MKTIVMHSWKLLMDKIKIEEKKQYKKMSRVEPTKMFFKVQFAISRKLNKSGNELKLF